MGILLFMRLSKCCVNYRKILYNSSQDYVIFHGSKILALLCNILSGIVYNNGKSNKYFQYSLLFSKFEFPLIAQCNENTGTCFIRFIGFINHVTFC